MDDTEQEPQYTFSLHTEIADDPSKPNQRMVDVAGGFRSRDAALSYFHQLWPQDSRITGCTVVRHEPNEPTEG